MRPLWHPTSPVSSSSLDTHGRPLPRDTHHRGGWAASVHAEDPRSTAGGRAPTVHPLQPPAPSLSPPLWGLTQRRPARRRTLALPPFLRAPPLPAHRPPPAAATAAAEAVASVRPPPPHCRHADAFLEFATYVVALPCSHSLTACKQCPAGCSAPGDDYNLNRCHDYWRPAAAGSLPPTPPPYSYAASSSHVSTAARAPSCTHAAQLRGAAPAARPPPVCPRTLTLYKMQHWSPPPIHASAPIFCSHRHSRPPVPPPFRAVAPPSP